MAIAGRNSWKPRRKYPLTDHAFHFLEDAASRSPERVPVSPTPPLVLLHSQVAGSLHYQGLTGRRMQDACQGAYLAKARV